MTQEVWGVDRFIEPDMPDCCPNCDRLLEDCTCRPDADDLYDRWRDAQMEEE